MTPDDEDILSQVLAHEHLHRLRLPSDLGDALAKIDQLEIAEQSKIGDRLIGLLSDAEPAIRNAAAWHFHWLAESDALDHILGGLLLSCDSPNPKVRTSAVFALGQLGPRAATSQVVGKLPSILEDHSASVRLSAVATLTRLGKEAVSVEVLLRLSELALMDSHDSVRKTAVEALETLDRELMLAVEHASQSSVDPVVESQGETSDKVRPTVDTGLHLWAARLLAVLRRHSVLEHALSEIKATLDVATGWGMATPSSDLGSATVRSTSGRDNSIRARSAEGDLRAELVAQPDSVQLLVRASHPGSIHFAVIQEASAIVASGTLPLRSRGKHFVTEKIWTGSEASSLRMALTAACVLAVGIAEKAQAE